MITTCIAVAALLFALIALACAAGQFVLTAKVQIAADKIIDNWEDKAAKVETAKADTPRHWYNRDLN
jgi:hypothetical protein